MHFTVTALRLLVGGLFIGHGCQKLFGWFGGSGLKKTGESFHSMGLRPGQAAAAAAGITEAGGGAWLAAGLATPGATAALTAVMVQAIRAVHGRRGPWVSRGGWEYNALIIAAVTAIAEHGPGPLSLDNELNLRLHGPKWAAASLAAGLAGPFIAQRVLGLFDNSEAQELSAALSE